MMNKTSSSQSRHIPFWYHLLITCIKPFYRWRVKKRSGHLPDYQAEITERFGDFQQVKNQHAIWFHAVSVGETNAAQPLIEHFLQLNYPVLVTNTTRTGQARAKALFAQKYPQLFQAVFLPLDQYSLIQRFVYLNQPRILLLIETELWPNLLRVLAEQHIPQLLLNARLSEKSARGYARFSSITRPILACLDTIAAQDHATAQRFATLGMPSKHIQIVGNIKFDITAPKIFIQQARQLHTQWQLNQRKIILLASTHQPEEQAILQALQPTLQQRQDIVCIVVPRHPERFEDVAHQITALHLTMQRRSLQQQILPDTQVYLADSMGEMWLWYALAQVAYVGGSLNSPGGGHNILEPIALNVATIVGKNYINFQYIVDEFARHHAIQIVDSPAQAAEALLAQLDDTSHRHQMTTQAAKILQQNRGALQQQISLINQFLTTTEE